MNWEEQKIDGLIEINSQSIDASFPFTKIEYIDTSSANEGRLEKVQILDLSEAPSRARRIVKDNSILYSTVRPNLKHFVFIEKSKPNLIASTGFAVIECKEGLEPRFLYAFLTTNPVVDYLMSIAEGQASTFPAFNPEAIKNIKIKLPPLPVQQRIAEILGRYDSLIENYAAQIRCLEASAQNVYREWFVRGRSPFAEYEKDKKLPVGWEEKELGEIAEDTRRIIKAKDLKPDTHYVGLEHLSVKSIIINSWGVAEDVDSDKLFFEKHDILFCKIRPYLHKVCLSHFEGVCSSDTIVIKPTIENALGFVMFTVFAERFIEFADKISNGTKMPRAEWSVLQTYKLIVPPEKTLKAFEEIVILIFSKMENLQTQITKLRQMRDKLLPRLLSGKIKV